MTDPTLVEGCDSDHPIRHRPVGQDVHVLAEAVGHDERKVVDQEILHGPARHGTPARAQGKKQLEGVDAAQVCDGGQKRRRRLGRPTETQGNRVTQVNPQPLEAACKVSQSHSPTEPELWGIRQDLPLAHRSTASALSNQNDFDTLPIMLVKNACMGT